MEAKDLALLFHNIYERLAPEHGYKTREETKIFDVKSPNGKLMIAVSNEILIETRDKIKQLGAELYVANKAIGGSEAENQRLKEAIKLAQSELEISQGRPYIREELNSRIQRALFHLKALEV